jgi:hypothetical protein
LTFGSLWFVVCGLSFFSGEFVTNSNSPEKIIANNFDFRSKEPQTTNHKPQTNKATEDKEKGLTSVSPQIL